MGIDATIEIRFNRDMSVGEFAHHLQQRGWSFNWDGKFRYWLSEPGLEWSYEPYENMHSTLKHLEKNRGKISLSAFCLDDEGERWDATFSFDEVDKTLLILDCPSGKTIKPHFRAAIDFSWYVARLLPDFETSSLNVEAINATAAYG